jgi:hypothetical protein
MKILIPDGMLARARRALGHGSGLIDDIQLFIIATAFCEHIAENPIVPTDEQVIACRRACGYYNEGLLQESKGVYVEWQRIMFLPPEPEVPEEIKDLLPGLSYGTMPANSEQFAEIIKGTMIEAYRRGQKAGPK